MSYYYSFDQYPAKQLDELWDAFMQGTLTTRIDARLARLEAEQREVETLPMVSKATFYEDRAEWMRCRENSGLLSTILRRKEELEELKKSIVKSEELLRTTRDKRKIKQVLTVVMEELNKGLTTTFLPECTGYSESAREWDFLFLKQVFETVTGKDLDRLKEIPATEEWKGFFQALTPDVLTKELGIFFKEQAIPVADQWVVRNQCFDLLIIVRNMLKTCLEREWELIFWSEYWSSDLHEKAIKERSQKRVQRFFDKMSSSQEIS